MIYFYERRRRVITRAWRDGTCTGVERHESPVGVDDDTSGTGGGDL